MFKCTFEGGQPVTTINVGGLFASEKVLSIMKGIILQSGKNYEVRKVAESLTGGLTCDYDKVYAIWDFVTSRTDYQFDPHGYEFIKTPLVPLKEIYNGIRPQLDCDDMTVLSMSLLLSVGLPVALRAASYRPDKQLTHVYGLVWIRKDKKWLPIDCVAKNGGPGWEKKPYTKIKDKKVS